MASVFHTTVFATVYGMTSHKYRNNEEENLLLSASGARKLTSCQEISCLESKLCPEDVRSAFSEEIFSGFFAA